MLTLNKVGGHNNLKEAEFYCLNKDKKPISKEGSEVPNGSILHIIDYLTTGVTKDWIYDGENNIWNEVPVTGGGGGGGVSNYPQLTNKPSINGVTLIGNKTSAELNIVPYIAQSEPPDDTNILWIDTDDETFDCKIKWSLWN